MSTTTLAAFIARCRILCRPQDHITDAELLRRFTQQRDADAGISAAMIGKGKLILAALLLASTLTGLAGPLLTQKTEPASTYPQTKAVAAETKKETPQVRKDRHGDPLPDGAIARLGTVRWRHGFFVHALAYSPDGKKIVSAGDGRAFVLWDVATGKELRVFPGPGEPRGVAFSPNGKIIATNNSPCQLWDATSGKMVRQLKNAQDLVSALAFAPDGKSLATANSDGIVHLWDPISGDEKHRIDCKQGRLLAVVFAPDGKLLASGGSDGTIRLWDAVTYKEVRRIAIPKKVIWSLVFSPDGKQLACGSEEDSPRLWDVATGREVRSFGDKQGTFAPLAFSPDGKLLAAGHIDDTFRLWDVASGEEKRHWQAGCGMASSLAFSPDGKTLATAVIWDGGIRLWDVATGRERHPSEGHHGMIGLLRFSADNASLISAGLDRNVLHWNVAAQTPQRQLTWTTDSFVVCALSPSSNILAVASSKTNEIWLWNVHNGNATKLPGKHSGGIQSIAFSPDGRLLASGGRDKIIRIWNMREKKEVRQIAGFGVPRLMKLLFTPDSKTLACGTRGITPEWTLHLWDVASGKEQRVFDNHGTGISPDAFSPDGKVLATATGAVRGQEVFVRLFDMTTGKELCRHSGHRARVLAMAFSPDGKLVASGGGYEDSSVHVWEAATGRLSRRFEGHHSGVFAVTFAADGLTVASGAGDSTILLWDITGRRGDGRWHAKPLTPRQLEACWTALADSDAAKAYDAVWALVAAPEQTVPFLRKHLPPAPRPDAKAASRLIGELDSDDFMVRRKATEELSKLGEAIAPALRQALDGKPSLEVRRRIQELLDQTRDWTPERLREHRAIQVLEHIGTRQAKEALQELSAGALGTLRSEEAKAALPRLTKRTASQQ